MPCASGIEAGSRTVVYLLPFPRPGKYGYERQAMHKNIRFSERTGVGCASHGAAVVLHPALKQALFRNYLFFVSH